jgi:hypothetical protein
MSEWITDRLPTREDAHVDLSVWVCIEGGVLLWSYDGISLGTPWQPIGQPAPYVKPKRWAVEWSATAKRYLLWFDGHYCHTMPKSCNYKAAKEIEHIYNEVMP